MNHLAVLFLLCIASCVCAGANIGNIGFQVHSWNDLRSWEQGFWKGVQWMKADLYWMPADFCSNQTQATQDPRGCFVLTHNSPQTTVQYNTTQSMLRYITSQKYSHYFKRLDHKMYIALCFKYTYGSVCDNTQEAQNWFSLTNDLFNTFSTAISNNNLNLEFVLDGAAASANCTTQNWRPWVKTWSGPTTDPAFMLNTQADGSDRLAVLDPPVYENDSDQSDPAYWVTQYASQNFGKFADSPYPWLWWEPMYQDTILDVSNTYLSTGQYHQPGFLFATNSDPVQFQIFSASATKQAWNHRVSSGTTVYTSHPFVTVLNSHGVHYIVIAFYTEQLTGRSNYYYVFSTDSVLGTINTITSRTSLSTTSGFGAMTNIKSATYENSSGSFNITMLFNSAGGYQGYRITQAGQLQRYCSGNLPHSSSVSYSSVDIIKNNNNLFLVEAFSSARNDLQFQLYQFDPNTCVATACGIPSSTTLPFTFNSLSVAIVSSGNGKYGGVVTFSALGRQIRAGYVTMSTDSQCNTQFTAQVASQAMDVGTDSVVSSVIVNNTAMIMEVHGNGYCWNSLDHNVGSALLCDTSPASVDSMLAYTYGPFNGWIQHIQANTKFSSCSPFLASGTYDGGLYPSAALFSSIDGSTAGVVAIHQGISPTRSSAIQTAIQMGQTQECGLPTANAGMLMDSWSLPSFAPSISAPQTPSSSPSSSPSRQPRRRGFTTVSLLVQSVGLSSDNLSQILASVMEVSSSIIEIMATQKDLASVTFKIYDTETTRSEDLANLLQTKIESQDPHVQQAGIVKVVSIKVSETGSTESSDEEFPTVLVAVGVALAGSVLLVVGILTGTLIFIKRKKSHKETKVEN